MDGFLQTLKRNFPGLSNTKVCSAENIPVPTEKVKVQVIKVFSPTYNVISSEIFSYLEMHLCYVCVLH